MPDYTYGRSHGRNRFGRRRYSKYVTKGYLKSIVGVPETKWTNTLFGPTQITNVGTIQLLNPITVGTGENQRIGTTVSNKTLHIRHDISRGATDSLLRVIVFWYLDGNQATPAPVVADILETISYQSPLNKSNGKSFWVKFDKTYTIAAGQTQLVVDEIWRKLKCQTEFNPDVAGPTNISANSLHILAISNQGVIANQPFFSFTSRLTYLDV